jgi:hypothetical protein
MIQNQQDSGLDRFAERHSADAAGFSPPCFKTVTLRRAMHIGFGGLKVVSKPSFGRVRGESPLAERGGDAGRVDRREVGAGQRDSAWVAMILSGVR